MPTVAVDAKQFHSRLGPILGQPEFNLEGFEEKIESVCFDFGLEYDGRDTDPVTNQVKLRFDVAASRYDLLCLDGLVDALLTFLRPKEHPFREYKWSTKEPQVTIRVDRSVVGIRPYVVGAIFRNVTLDDVSFKAFIELQDKLHQNLCRRRTLVAIGTHNLDVMDVSGPVTYKALPKKGGFRFVPLYQTEECDAERMFELFEDSHIKPYLHITRDFDLTPVIQDCQGRVLSVPPIINGEFSKMSEKTQNVFVEVTATDLRKAEIVLDVITCFMSQKVNPNFTVEPVRIEYAEDHPGAPRRHAAETKMVHEMITPSLTTDKFVVDVDYVKRLIGYNNLTPQSMLELLEKMSMRGQCLSDGKVQVECPISRRDVLHACDIAEDVAIAIGYNNIARRAHPAVSLQTINNLSERVRRQIAQAGWNECLTFGLVSHANAYEDLRRQELQDVGESAKELFSVKTKAARVSEPKTREFEIIRPTLISGLLNTLSSNQHAQLPIRIFEIGDCVVCDPSADNKIQHRRHVAALVADNSRSGLEEVHGLLDYVLKGLNLRADYHHQNDDKKIYKLQESKESTVFLAGRGVDIIVDDDRLIGIMGVVHPEVLQKYSIPFPCSLFELSLDLFTSTLHHTELSAP